MCNRKETLNKKTKIPYITSDMEFYRNLDVNFGEIKKIRRCKKCLLPETMPFIEFDDDGVCNYCHTWKEPEHFGEEKLQKWAEDYKRNTNGKILVSFSGGRDSSYSLHYLTKELGLNTIAYSYDWGIITDLGRRNQSKMCEALNTELITVTADIKKKKENIKKNVLAWLKKPALGMVPLFMAGDKQYYYYADRVSKERKIDVICMANNKYEQTHFKYGFCGIRPTAFLDNWKKGTEELPKSSVAKLAGYYAKEFITNPSYINASILDTASAAISNYGIKHNYLRFFDYVHWNEKKVEQILFDEYDWETLPYSKCTWRIGDGTAPFYNYIYLMTCGFTENDCMRSNQIRAGHITREEGKKLVERDNQIQWDGLKWYFDMIDVDMKEALSVVKNMRKRY